MAFVNKSTKIIIFLLAIFSSRAFANLDCGGKPFLCVNSTHFHVCVDFGNSVSFTVDNFIIPCPRGTECSAKNHFECEIPAPTIPAAIHSTNYITNDGKAKEERSVSTTTMWDVVTTTVPVSSVNEAEYSEKYSNTENPSSLFNSATIGPSHSATTVPTKSIVFSEITNNSFPIGETINDKINSALDNDTAAGPFHLPPILANDTGPMEYSLTSATTTDGITSTVQSILYSYTTASYILNEISANFSDNTLLPVSETIMQSDKPASTTTNDPTADFIGLKLSTGNDLFYDHLSNTTESVTKETIEDLPIFAESATKETVQDIITTTENAAKATIPDTTASTENAVKAQDSITSSTESVKITSIAESATKETTQDLTTESMHVVTQTPAEWIDSNLDVLSSVPASNEPVLITFSHQNSSEPVQLGILPIDSPTTLNASDVSGLTALESSSNISEPSPSSWSNLDVATIPILNSSKTKITNNTNETTDTYTSVEGENINHAELAQESSTQILYYATQPEALETSTENDKVENQSMQPAIEITTENSQQKEITFKSAKSDPVRKEENKFIMPLIETTTENTQQHDNTERISTGETYLQNPLENIILNGGNNYSLDKNNNPNNNSTGPSITKNEDKDITRIVDNDVDTIREISNIMKKTFVEVKQDESTAKIRTTTQNEDQIQNIHGYDTIKSQSEARTKTDVMTFSIQNTDLPSTETSTTLSNGIFGQSIGSDFSNAASTQEAPDVYLNMVLENKLLPKHEQISPGATDSPLNIKDVIGGKLPWQGPKEQSMVESPDRIPMYEVPADGGVNKKESELGLTENSAFENLSSTKPLQLSTSNKTEPGASSLGLDFQETITSTEPTIKVTTDSIVIIDSTHTYTVKVSVDKNINNQEKNIENGNLLSKLSEAIKREQLNSDAGTIPITQPTQTIKPTVEQPDTNKTGIDLLSNEPRETSQTVVKHDYLSVTSDDSNVDSKVTTNQDQNILPAIVKTIKEKKNAINPNLIGKIYTSSSPIVLPISTKPSIEATTSTILGPYVVTTPASATNEDIIVTQSMLSFAASTDGSNGGVTFTTESSETAITASLGTRAKANEEGAKLNVDTISPNQSIDVTTMTTTTMGNIVAIDSLTATSESIQVPKVTPLEVSLVSPTLPSDVISDDVYSTTGTILITPKSQNIVANENRNADEMSQKQLTIDGVTTQQIEDKVLLATATTMRPVMKITEASTTSPEPIQARLFQSSDIYPVVVSSSSSVISGGQSSTTESIVTTSESYVTARIVANEDTIKKIDELTIQQGNNKVSTRNLTPIAVTEALERLQVTKSMPYEVALDISPSSSKAVITEDVSSSTKTTLESSVPPGIMTNEDGKESFDDLTTQKGDVNVLILTPMPSSSIIVTEVSTTASEAIQATSLPFNPNVIPSPDSVNISGAVSYTTEHIRTTSESRASQKIMANEDTLQSVDGFTTRQGIEVTLNKTNGYPTSTNGDFEVTELFPSQLNLNVPRPVSSTTESENQKKTPIYYQGVNPQGIIETTAPTIEKEERLSIAESNVSSTNETSTSQAVSPIGSQQGVMKTMAPTTSGNEKGERLSIAVSSGTASKVISSSSSLITSPASLNKYSSGSQSTINVNTPVNPTKEAKISINTDSYGMVEPVLNTYLFNPSTGKERVQTRPSNLKTNIKTVPDKLESEKDADKNIYRDATQKSTTENSKPESTTASSPKLVNKTVTSEVSKANSSINVANNKKDTHTLEVSPKATTGKPSQVKQPPAPNPKFICTNLPRGRYSDKNDCRTFYICVDKPDPIVGHCPINTVFSEIKKQCVRNLSHCIRGNEFKCTAHGRFVDYNRENIYYVCIRSANIFLRFKFQCQAGYSLDRTAIRCKHRVDSQIDSVSISDSVHNKDKSQSTKSASSSSNSSKKSSKYSGNTENEFTCKKVGNFPHQSDSRKYYICYTKKSQLKKKIGRCDSDEQFNTDKKKCIEDEE